MFPLSEGNTKIQRSTKLPLLDAKKIECHIRSRMTCGIQ